MTTRLTAYAPTPAAQAVIDRYGISLKNRVDKQTPQAGIEQRFLTRMRVMQRDLIQAHLPQMALEDALRATRTLDQLAAQDAAEAV